KKILSEMNGLLCSFGALGIGALMGACRGGWHACSLSSPLARGAQRFSRWKSSSVSPQQSSWFLLALSSSRGLSIWLQVGCQDYQLLLGWCAGSAEHPGGIGYRKCARLLPLDASAVWRFANAARR